MRLSSSSSSLLLVAAVACLFLATVIASSEALTPAARIAKLGWRQAGLASPKATVKFTLALKQRNLQLFEQMFLEISNPKSSKYAQYLSIDEILDIVAPPAEDAAFVVNWLKDQCEENEIVNLRDALKVTSTVACVEKMFSVKLHNYKYRNTPFSVIKTKLNTAAAQIPKELLSYVELLEGLSRLPIPRKATHKTEVDATLIDAKETFNYVIPSVVRRLYNIPEGTTIQSSQSSHSVIEFLPVGAPYISDMQMFSQQANETFSNITKIVGPFEEGYNDGESTLDIQYISALAPGGENWYITIQDGWQYEFALELFNMANAPWVNSVSYGWPEQKSCQSGITHANCKGLDSKTYVERANVEFQKIGTRGITVIVCSQDEGAPSEANEDCQLDSTHPLWPIYPSASPWVTTVSATTVIDTGNGGHQPQPPICADYPCASGTLEYPCMINNTLYTWTTGGGFSAFATRPSYQETAVQQWLSSGAIIPPQQFFNSSNRGYPDISALGSRILIVQSGAVAVTAGTSASTPIIAAVMALLNDYRFQQGKPSLGFLNPLLYQMAAEAPQTFQIVNVGNNQGTIGVECEYGYGASWGWDPVTGLGTPNYAEMINYLENNLP